MTESMFSHPSGNPASLQGKGSTLKWILRLEAFAWSMTMLNLVALRGVRTMVTVIPLAASNLANCVKGIRWLWDMKGTRRKCCW